MSSDSFHNRWGRHQWRCIKRCGTIVVSMYVLLVLWMWMFLHSGTVLEQPDQRCFFCGHYSSNSQVPVGDSFPSAVLAMDHTSFPYPHLVHNASLLHQSAPIVVQLRGEMGNHLSTIAHGIGLQLVALQDHNLSTHLILRHQTVAGADNQRMQDSPKWEPTRQILQRCFPAMKQWQFALGSQWIDFDRRWNHQQTEYTRYLVNANSNNENVEDPLCQQKASWWQQSSLVNGKPMVGHLQGMKEPITDKDIAEGLSAFANLWRMEQGRNARENGDDDKRSPPPFLSTPFLFSDSMDNLKFVTRFLPVFRQIFRTDPSCCGQLRPNPNESVFHFRNFAREFHVGSSPSDTLPSFEEVTPQQTANVLFANLQPGDKVAIASRFENDPIVNEHVKALQKRGFHVRVVTGSNKSDNQQQNGGMQDFCFLLRAKKEFIGNFRSTFAVWAALLGDAKFAKLYTIKSPGLKKRFGPFVKQFFTGNYSWDLQEDNGDLDSRRKQVRKDLQMKLIPYGKLS